MDFNDIIKEIFEYDDYRHCTKKPCISASRLIGPKYKAKLQLEGAETDESLIPYHLKRSSTLGTAFHQYAERTLGKLHPDYITELFGEKIVDGITISGTADLLVPTGHGTYILCDFKTGYGKERKADALEKDAMQMSIYRWLFKDHLKIEDIGYTLFISQSNNNQEAYPVMLKDEDWIEEYIENYLFAVSQQETSDCNDNIKYNGCLYCSFSQCSYRREK
jgi:hypothetical protein